MIGATYEVMRNDINVVSVIPINQVRHISSWNDSDALYEGIGNEHLA